MARKSKQARESVSYWVEDAVGEKYCYTVADAAYAPLFRKHVTWWKHHVRTAKGREAYRNHFRGPPVFPVSIKIQVNDLSGE